MHTWNCDKSNCISIRLLSIGRHWPPVTAHANSMDVLGKRLIGKFNVSLICIYGISISYFTSIHMNTVRDSNLFRRQFSCSLYGNAYFRKLFWNRSTHGIFIIMKMSSRRLLNSRAFYYKYIEYHSAFVPIHIQNTTMGPIDKNLNFLLICN